MVSWIHYHNQMRGELPVILSGLSMGASTMLYLADQNLPANVKGIIADCGFTSPKAILSSVFRSVIHLPAGPTLIGAELFSRLFAGFSLTEKDTRKALKNSKIPVFMVHGMADDFVPCDMSRRMYEKCPSRKALYIVPGADHGLAFPVANEKYIAELKAFFE